MHTVTLTAAPALGPILARGVLLSPFKRPGPDAHVPRIRVVLPGVRIDFGRLVAYERVCGFATGADALPVTYPHVLGFPLAMRIMAGRGFPLPLLGLVHTSVEITQRQELAATGEYEITVYVEGLAPHRRGTEATVVTEVRGVSGLIWESRSTYLARHRVTGNSTASAPEPHERQPLPAALPAHTEWHLGADVGRRYGAASGDRNPIHLYPLTARLFGFPRPIAHGMWTVARCLAEHGVPEAAHIRAEFKAPVLLPGTVTYAAEGPAFELRDGNGDSNRVHLTGTVRTIKGTTASLP